MRVIFPKYNGQRYYHSHYEFVLNLFGNDIVSLHDFKEGEVNEIPLIIDGKECFINFSDHGILTRDNGTIFKMHCNGKDGTFPFSPMSFIGDWSWYDEQKIEYKANGYISNRQRAYGNAKERREFVNEKLERYTNDCDSYSSVHVTIPQEDYFNDVENILVSVCVPGACNNMLDRGQLQYMALGACTISPNLPEVLPFNKLIRPWEHYIQCYDNYSDLEAWLDWCKENREACIEIGINAKKLFLETCHPNAIKKWIKECLQ